MIAAAGSGAAPGAAFLRRVRAGGLVVGTFVKLAGLEPVDLAAGAGLDFVVVDAEHSQLPHGEVARQVRHAAAIGLPALVRLPSVDPGLVNRLVEAGAVGVQVSSVRRATQATALHDALRYPPQGTRSVSAAQPAAGYGRRPLPDYLAAVAGDPPLVVGQVETATTDDPLGEVVAPLDVVFLGTTDLSVDLGRPGDTSHPEVRRRIAEVASAAAGAKVVLGGWASGPQAARRLQAAGASYLVVGSDLNALGQGLSTVAEAVREGTGAELDRPATKEVAP